jgi:hypothetical protein
VLFKDTGVKGRAGVAWKQDDGSIQIILDPCVTLYGQALMHNGEKVYLTLFPLDWKKKERVEPAPSGINPEAGAKAGRRDDLEDDIPF